MTNNGTCKDPLEGIKTTDVVSTCICGKHNTKEHEDKIMREYKEYERKILNK